MRILYWSDPFWPNVGGIEIRAARLVRALRERGHHVVVVAAHLGLDLPDLVWFGDVPVHRFAFWNALGPRDLQRIADISARVNEIKRDFQPEVVHIDAVMPSVFFHLRTVRSRRTPLLVTIQQAGIGAPMAQRDGILIRLLEAADWVTFCSEAIRAEVLRQFPGVRTPHSVIHNAGECPPGEREPPSFDPPRLVCIGRLAEEKGFDLAIDAFALVLARFPTASLVVAGDGPERERLMARAQALGVASRTEFPGWIEPDRVADLMTAATAVVCPSRREAFGLAALEAALVGRPVVATRVGGLGEVVADGVTGILVEPEDSHALAAGIVQLLVQPAAAVEMGVCGRQRARERFSWDRHVDAYEALYRKLGKETVYADV
jgi:glycosyltransferase involved in cell wall biosynthesis